MFHPKTIYPDIALLVMWFGQVTKRINNCTRYVLTRSCPHLNTNRQERSKTEMKRVLDEDEIAETKTTVSSAEKINMLSAQYIAI